MSRTEDFTLEKRVFHSGTVQIHPKSPVRVKLPLTVRLERRCVKTLWRGGYSVGATDYSVALCQLRNPEPIGILSTNASWEWTCRVYRRAERLLEEGCPLLIRDTDPENPLGYNRRIIFY